MLRSSFGIIGSNVPALIRALVACGWFGIQTLFGGIAVHLMLAAMSDTWAQLGGVGEVIGFFIFWVANVWVVLRGSESIKWLEVLAAPLLMLVGVGLLVWAWPQASVTELLARPPSRPADASFWAYFFAGLTAMVGFWATLSLNIPDFSRFAKSQRAQIVGQIVGLPVTMVLFAGLGVVMTAASAQLVGETVSDPITLIGKIDNPFWVVLSMIIIIIATISTNTAANIVSPTNDFQNLAPRLINQKKGVLLTGFIGIALMSWELLKRMGWLRIGCQRRQPVFELAPRLLEPARPHRRHHGGGLFRGAPAALRSAGAVPEHGPVSGLESRRFRGSGRARRVDDDRDHHRRAAMVLHLRLVHRVVPRRDSSIT